MKSPNLKYKGFQGSVEHDLENGILYGKVLYVNDTVSYETSGGIIDLEREFKDAVEDYIETCAELGREPNKPFKGSFNVRVGPERHKAAVLAGADIGLNLNEFCKEAIDEKIDRSV